MSQKHFTRRQAGRVGSAGALAAAGSVLAAGTLFSGAESGQEVLPRPDAPFKGKIGQTYKDSNPDKIPVTKAPTGYYPPDIINIFYSEAQYRWHPVDGLGVLFMGQYTSQRSVGENLLTGSRLTSTPWAERLK